MFHLGFIFPFDKPFSFGKPFDTKLKDLQMHGVKLS